MGCLGYKIARLDCMHEISCHLKFGQVSYTTELSAVESLKQDAYSGIFLNESSFYSGAQFLNM